MGKYWEDGIVPAFKTLKKEEDRTKVQELVGKWLDGCDPVPQITFAQSEYLQMLIADYGQARANEQKSKDLTIAANVAYEDPEFESEPIPVIKGVELAGRKIESLIRKG